MANYDYVTECPNCGLHDINLLNYSALMVLRSDLGLFTVECPNCAERLTSIQTIPEEIYKDVVKVADEIGAGMGRY